MEPRPESSWWTSTYKAADAVTWKVQEKERTGERRSRKCSICWETVVSHLLLTDIFVWDRSASYISSLTLILLPRIRFLKTIT